jgi:hypothetical protein
LLLLVPELGLRLFTSEDTLLFSWERSDAWLHLDPSGATWVSPNLHMRRDIHPDPPWELHTNSQGFREPADTPARRPKGTYRILALGDSWMFGLGVNDAQTIPSQVEQMLAEQKGWNVEIINAGVPGFRAWDMWRRWALLRDRLEIDGLLLGAPHNQGTREGDADSGVPSVTPPASRLRTYLLVRWLLGRWRGPMYAPGPPDPSQGSADTISISNIVTEALARDLDVWLLLMPGNLAASIDPVGGVATLHDGWLMDVDRSKVWIAGHTLDERSCWHQGDIGHPSARGTWALASALTGVMVNKQSTSTTWNTPRCSDAASSP